MRISKYCRMRLKFIILYFIEWKYFVIYQTLAIRAKVPANVTQFDCILNCLIKPLRVYKNNVELDMIERGSEPINASLPSYRMQSNTTKLRSFWIGSVVVHDVILLPSYTPLLTNLGRVRKLTNTVSLGKRTLLSKQPVHSLTAYKESFY